MTRRFAYLALALALAAGACKDKMDDRKESADENAGQQAAPADTAKAPGT